MSLGRLKIRFFLCRIDKVESDSFPFSLLLLFISYTYTLIKDVWTLHSFGTTNQEGFLLWVRFGVGSRWSASVSHSFLFWLLSKECARSFFSPTTITTYSCKHEKEKGTLSLAYALPVRVVCVCSAQSGRSVDAYTTLLNSFALAPFFCCLLTPKCNGEKWWQKKGGLISASERSAL